jgi:hypothetical protein
MNISRSKLQTVLPILIGAGLAVLLFLGIAYFREGGPRDTNSNDRAEMLQLITQMRINMASASEAETSAVVAPSDQASAGFAEQARAATASVERARSELAPLISRSSTNNEKDFFAKFSQAFSEFQQVQATLLDLAVKNTNVKAYALAFGPATEALRKLDDALNRLMAANEGTPDAVAVSTAAIRVQIGALRIQTLLSPHIAEAEDKKMDQLEAAMSAEDKTVRDNLDRLAQMDQAKNRTLVDAAKSAYEDFAAIRKNILALSRENTNVRSLAISLDQKRKVTALCQESLDALQQVVQQSLIKPKIVNPRAILGPQ